jgi:hypothetical protein
LDRAAADARIHVADARTDKGPQVLAGLKATKPPIGVRSAERAIPLGSIDKESEVTFRARRMPDQATRQLSRLVASGGPACAEEWRNEPLVRFQALD